MGYASKLRVMQSFAAMTIEQPPSEALQGRIHFAWFPFECQCSLRRLQV